MEDYGIGKWRELKESEKIRHSLYECNECLLKHSCKNTFPTVAGHRNAKKSFKITNSDTNTTSKPTISLSPIKPQQNNIEIRTPLQNIINLTPANKHTLSEMKEVAGSVLQNISNQWDEIFDTPFTKILPKLPDTNLREKESVAEKKRKLRKMHKNMKNAIETSWQKENLDVKTLFGTRQSKSSYMKSRASCILKKKHQLWQEL